MDPLSSTCGVAALARSNRPLTLEQWNARYEAVETGIVEAGHTVAMSLERQGTDKEGKKGDRETHDHVNIELGSHSGVPAGQGTEERNSSALQAADHAGRGRASGGQGRGRRAR